jgi:hypothetical protein
VSRLGLPLSISLPQLCTLPSRRRVLQKPSRERLLNGWAKAHCCSPCAATRLLFDACERTTHQTSPWTEMQQLSTVFASSAIADWLNGTPPSVVCMKAASGTQGGPRFCRPFTPCNLSYPWHTIILEFWTRISVPLLVRLVSYPCGGRRLCSPAEAAQHYLNIKNSLRYHDNSTTHRACQLRFLGSLSFLLFHSRHKRDWALLYADTDSNAMMAVHRRSQRRQP